MNIEEIIKYKKEINIIQNKIIKISSQNTMELVLERYNLRALIILMPFIIGLSLYMGYGNNNLYSNPLDLLPFIPFVILAAIIDKKISKNAEFKFLKKQSNFDKTLYQKSRILFNENFEYKKALEFSIIISEMQNNNKITLKILELMINNYQKYNCKHGTYYYNPNQQNIEITYAKILRDTIKDTEQKDLILHLEDIKKELTLINEELIVEDIDEIFITNNIL